MSGLEGPRVDLTFRWIAQHIASCPLTGAMCCAPPSCVQGLAELGQQGRRTRDAKLTLFWLTVFLLSIWVCFPWIDMLGLNNWGGVATVASAPVHPVRQVIARSARVTVGEPTPDHLGVYVVVFLTEHVGSNTGRSIVRPHFFSWVGVFFLWFPKALYFSFGKWWSGCCLFGGPDIRGRWLVMTL